MIIGHGGNIYTLAKRLQCKADEIVDMSSNVNPLGPPDGLVEFLQQNISGITALPEVDAGELIQSFSSYYGIHPDRVLAGNGTTQFIYLIPKALETRKALILAPAYADYTDACIQQKVDFRYLITKEGDNFSVDMDRVEKNIKGADTVFICNPNNPTGALILAKDLESLFGKYPETVFIVDESYLPFVPSHKTETLIHSRHSNAIVLNSMSKIFRIPGLRIGFLVAAPEVIRKFSPYLLPWSVNSLAQAAGQYLFERPEVSHRFMLETQAFLKMERACFYEQFKANPLIKFFPSVTSFILAKLNGSVNSDNVCERLAHEKILIRNCSNFTGLSEKFIRISLKNREDNLRLAEKLRSIISV